MRLAKSLAIALVLVQAFAIVKCIYTNTKEQIHENINCSSSISFLHVRYRVHPANQTHATCTKIYPEACDKGHASDKECRAGQASGDLEDIHGADSAAEEGFL
jgi:hypothetical protein